MTRTRMIGSRGSALHNDTRLYHLVPRRVLALIIMLLAALTAGGCHTWRPVAPVSPARLDSLQGKPLRVQPVAGAPFDATQWTVRGDSLFVQQPTRDSLALAQVEQLEVKQPNGGHTAGLIISIALGAFAVAFTTVAIMVHNSD